MTVKLLHPPTLGRRTRKVSSANALQCGCVCEGVCVWVGERGNMLMRVFVWKKGGSLAGEGEQLDWSNGQIKFGIIPRIWCINFFANLKIRLLTNSGVISASSKELRRQRSAWPDKNHQMSIKVAQKWFH